MSKVVHLLQIKFAQMNALKILSHLIGLLKRVESRSWRAFNKVWFNKNNEKEN